MAASVLGLWAIGLAMVGVGGLYGSTVRPHDWPPGFPLWGVLFSASIVTLQVLLLALILWPWRAQQYVWQFGVALLVFGPLTLVNFFVRVAVWDDPGFITALFDWALIVDAVLSVLLVAAILEWRRESESVA